MPFGYSGAPAKRYFRCCEDAMDEAHGVIKTAAFPYRKTIEDYDFQFQENIDRKKIEDLATLRFIENNENVLFVGSSGTGKTHLATAIGINGITGHGKRARFHSTVDLVNALEKEKRDGYPPQD